jgi:hypothetical protein
MQYYVFIFLRGCTWWWVVLVGSPDVRAAGSGRPPQPQHQHQHQAWGYDISKYWQLPGHVQGPHSTCDVNADTICSW